MSRLLLCALLLGAAQAFVVPAVRPGLHRHSLAAPAASTPSVLQPTAVPARVASAPQMGLFGLGWAELGVIGLLAIFIFGPEKLAPLAKDLGVPRFKLVPQLATPLSGPLGARGRQISVEPQGGD